MRAKSCDENLSQNCVWVVELETIDGQFSEAVWGVVRCWRCCSCSIILNQSISQTSRQSKQIIYSVISRFHTTAGQLANVLFWMAFIRWNYSVVTQCSVERIMASRTFIRRSWKCRMIVVACMLVEWPWEVTGRVRFRDCIVFGIVLACRAVVINDGIYDLWRRLSFLNCPRCDDARFSGQTSLWYIYISSCTGQRLATRHVDVSEADLQCLLRRWPSWVVDV